MPFPVKAIQVDGGSEFQSVFEEACCRLGIRLFVLPPRSPKLNGHVERAHRTHTEEFYEVTEAEFDIRSLNKALLKWEKVYNTIRPHQALKYLTPQQYLELRRKEKVYGIY
jgi:transposase InsO family protein